MATKKKKSSPQKSRGLAIVLACLVSIVLCLGLIASPTVFRTQGASSFALPFTPQAAKETLQLYWFLLPSPTVPPPATPVRPRPTVPLVPQTKITPVTNVPIKNGPPAKDCGIAHAIHIVGKDAQGKCCVQDGPVNSPSDCCPSVPYCDLRTNPPTAGSPDISCTCNNKVAIQPNGGKNQSFCHSGTPPGPYWCNAKPIIYLYPEEPLYVDVSVWVPGEITVSDPLYPKGGWKDVLAYPDGTLLYQGGQYHDLFYESSVTPIDPPERGIVVPMDQAEPTLRNLATKLGLRGYETDDLLAYWIPRLNELQTPYLIISYFPQEQKEQIDAVTIMPKPDTFIEMIFYFKGIEQPIAAKPLQLPQETPARVGFTAVEWGGIIDQ